MSQQQILNNRFEVAPSMVNRPRSRFVIPYRHKTTFNFGDVVPVFEELVQPGDTFTVSSRALAWMSTPLFPVMDDAFVQTFWFFVPMRLLWSHWAEFLGENKTSAWTQPQSYTVPHKAFAPTPGGLADHMGVPTYDAASLSAFNLDSQPMADVQFLFFRAYWLTHSEWFRNENTTDPTLVNTGDTVTTAEVRLTEKLLKASKLFDPYTSALPAPQKGSAVDVPLLGLAPLIKDSVYPDWLSDHTFDLAMLPDSGSTRGPVSAGEYYDTVGHVETTSPERNVLEQRPGYKFNSTDQSALDAFGEKFAFVDTYADLSQTETFTINQLRYAFQLQRILERQAIAGSRMVEIIAASFGVRSSDYRLMRPEYLGGCRVPLQMSSVTQTSSTDAQSPLGHVAAQSKTILANRDFSASFNEHGVLLGLICVRHVNSYMQGLPPKFSIRDRYSIFWPEMDHIGYQPMFKKELFLTGASTDDEPFGYNEAWWWYRYFTSQITGQFRSTVQNNLDEWHWADVYDEVPTLSADWMEADKDMVDRTLAVTSEVHDQIILDFKADVDAVRVMSMSSYPGAIDHY